MVDGLKNEQKECVLKVLNQEDVFWLAASGAGKSAAFQVPILVHDEVHKNQHLYPGFEAKERVQRIIMPPTKGLAGNIVCIQRPN